VAGGRGIRRVRKRKRGRENQRKSERRDGENQCTSIMDQQAGGPLYVQRLEEEREKESMYFNNRPGKLEVRCMYKD
jgi:hypothetical protein